MDHDYRQLTNLGLAELCIDCAALDFDKIFEGKYSFKRDLDKLLTRFSCPFCLFLVRCLAQESAFDSAFACPERESIHVNSDEAWGCEAEDIYSSVSWLKLSVGGGTSSEEKAYGCSIQRLKSPAAEQITDGRCYLWGRRVYDELDLLLLRLWMECCIGFDGSLGHSSCKPKAAVAGIPKLLVEINTKSVVSAPADCQYAALSYVWGAPHISQLHHRNLSRGPNGWLLDPNWAEVPQTIKDAMLLCELLSIPFLWVDVLCIEEYHRDSFASCNTELSEQMSNIYGGAYLTIVAAAGDDSWAGLPGIRKGSRVVLQQSVIVGGMLLASVQTSPRDTMRSTTWNRRAWTCQEGFLSNRLLIFTKHQVFWNCNMDLFWEDIHREIPPDEISTEWNQCIGGEDFLEVKRDLHRITSFCGYEFFQCYTNLVEDYTKRNLTYQQDALDAFGGVLASLRDHLDTEFFYGLPIRFFEQSLLFDTGCFLPESRRICFPSWTWVGWNQELQGAKGIRFPKWHGTRRNMYWSLNDFKSVITWYRFDHSQGGTGHIFGVIKGILNQGAEELAKGAPFKYCCLPDYVNPSQVLVLEASTAFLRVQITPFMESHPLLSKRFTIHLSGDNSEAGPAESSISTASDKPIGSLMLDPTWRGSSKDVSEFEFIAIAKETRELIQLRYDDPREDTVKEVIHTLMITTDSCGISQRLHVFSLDEPDWIAAKPRQRMIYLI